MNTHKDTQRRTERDTQPRGGNPTGPTTREEMLRAGAAAGTEPAEPRATHSVSGGHEAQDIASRDQIGGHGRLHKADEQPLWERKPGGKPANARS